MHRERASQCTEQHRGGFVQNHKFKVGQVVGFTSGPFGRGGPNEIYKITQLLPSEDDDCQYRIKNANEPHERVVKESQLNRIASSRN
jgi:hypothetical protein